MPAALDAVFDDPNLVSCGGLAPVLGLAQRCGLHGLVADKVSVAIPGGVSVRLHSTGVGSETGAIASRAAPRQPRLTNVPSSARRYPRLFRAGFK
jgi:hypothetical protein